MGSADRSSFLNQILCFCIWISASHISGETRFPSGKYNMIQLGAIDQARQCIQRGDLVTMDLLNEVNNVLIPDHPYAGIPRGVTGIPIISGGLMVNFPGLLLKTQVS